METSVTVGSFEITYHQRGGGSDLQIEGEAGSFRLRSEQGSFWTADLRDRHGTAATINGAGASLETTRRRENDTVEVVFTWRDEPVELHEETGTATTTLRGRFENGDPTSYWSAEVTLTGVAATLIEFSLPVVDDVYREDRDRADDHLILPGGWGLDIENPFQSPSRAGPDKVQYPSAACTMQFLSLVNGETGLYVAAHDPAGRPKSMTATPDVGDKTLRLSIDHYPAERTEPTSTYRLPYVVAIGTFAGDWYDAAQRYRKWVLDAANWTWAGPIAEREHPPQIRDLAMWWLLAPRETDHERDRTLIKRLHEEFPVQTGVHWYTWHPKPFDVDYPDYFPPREGWIDAVQDLEADGITVMPYVNARIADPNSDAWRDQDLIAGAARGASSRLAPSHRPLRYETYNDQRMVAMCPTTSTWQKTMTDVAERLNEETPVSAIYFDQLAAKAPPQCYAREHDHPSGGGTDGVDGYRELLATVGDRTDLAVTTENSAEPYLDRIDGHLLWNSARSDLVPLFSAVYGDYTLMFGRQFFGVDLERDGAFRSKLAQSLVFGAQPGWVRHHVAESLLDGPHEDERRYLRGAVEAITAIDGVHVGRRLRDPVVQGSPTRTVEWEMYRHGSWHVDLPAVLCGLWRPDEGSGPGTIASALTTNWTGTDHDVTLALPNDQLAVADVRAIRVRPDDAAVVVDETALATDGTVALQVPAYSTAIVEFSA
jgi:hypothetical protein